MARRRNSDPSGGSLLSMIRFGAFAALTVLIAGFALFSLHVARLSPDPEASADAIIVLTGGEGRLAVATELLERRAGSRLLISGVHPDVTPDELRAAMGTNARLFDCCVDLGRQAADTTGNAIETAEWVSERGYGRVVIVTSDYHLPRSLLEIRARMPDVELIAYPVASPRPWSDLNSTRRWVLEYLKFTAVWVRYGVSNPHD